MGQCLKICEGLLPENGRLHRHFGNIHDNVNRNSVPTATQLNLTSKLQNSTIGKRNSAVIDAKSIKREYTTNISDVNSKLLTVIAKS